jgi:hypothetical protein
MVLQRFTIPGDGKSGFIGQRRETRQPKAERTRLRFNKKTFAVLKEHDPSVPNAVASVPSEHDSGVESHSEQLAPSPEGEVFAVTSLPFLEVLRRLPVVLFVKQFSVGDTATTMQKLAHILDGLALNGQRLANVTTHRKRGMRSFATKKGLRDLLAVRVVSFGNDLRNHPPVRAMRGWSMRKRRKDMSGEL